MGAGNAVKLGERVYFQSGNLKLEGMFHRPNSESSFPAVVVCHPHPLYGGSMDNNVVLAVTSVLLTWGIGVFRFNFRGVGMSQGSHSGGTKEEEDALAALAFLRGIAEIKSEKLGVAGYSFGAVVALTLSARLMDLSALALVSPPIRSLVGPDLGNHSLSTYLVTGDRDSACPVEAFLELAQGFPASKEYSVISGADHFWGDGIHLQEACSKIGEFFNRAFHVG